MHFLVHALVLRRTFNGVGALDENAFDLLVVEQPRAIDEFVNHSGGQVIGQRTIVRVQGF